jgi:uncharacterized membrane protein
MSPIGIVHTSCGVLALVFGTTILLLSKGTRTHVRVGWAYVVCMAGVNATALCIYQLTGHFNLFHALALGSLVMVVVGLGQVVPRRRPRNWLWRHYQYMCWSFVGLLAATNNEAFVRVPVLQRLTTQTLPALPLLTTAALVGVCAVVIVRRQTAILARYGAPGRINEAEHNATSRSRK